jgi:hypothetical protein
MPTKTERLGRRVLRAAVASVSLLSLLGFAADGDESRSASPARELASLMKTQHVDAFAAPNPDAPNTFVAALLVDGQLMVVSGQPTSPAYTQAQLAQRNYSEVYSILHQAVVPESKIFIQDLKGDGLHLKTPDSVDVLYERVANQTIFDGAPSKHKLTDAQYAEKFTEADARYSRLLTILIESLKQGSAGTGTRP